jgi:hypothetical protein
MRRLLSWGALASLAAGGLSAASVWREWSGGGTGHGFTASAVLNLFAVLPEIVVLFALLRLARAVVSSQLYRSSLCLYITFWLVALLSLFINKGLSEGLMIVLVIPMIVAVLAMLIFKIWFAVALIRVRDRLSGLAGVLGAVVLLNAGVWLVFRILSVIGDESSAFDRADSLRSLVGVVLSALLLFMLFLSVRDQLIEES